MLPSFNEYSFSSKQLRMLEDDAFLQVQESDVMALLTKMKQAGLPRSEVVRIRKKYDRFIHDKEKALMVRLNLNYEEHNVEYNRSFYTINGYTEFQWCLLNVDDFVPKNRQTLFQAIDKLKKAGKQQDAERIEAKYQGFLAREKEKSMGRFRAKHSLSDDVQVSDMYHIVRFDNLPPSEWRCFNDPDYIPPRQIFTKLMKKYGEYEDLTAYYFLFDKYSDIFACEDGEPPVSLEEAQDIFNQLFGKPKQGG